MHRTVQDSTVGARRLRWLVVAAAALLLSSPTAGAGAAPSALGVGGRATAERVAARTATDPDRAALALTAGAAPAVRSKRITLSGGPRLTVNVDPNLKGSRSWRFRLQRWSAGTWRTLGTFRTWGRAEKRAFAVPAGTYRVRVLAGHGRKARTSKALRYVPARPRPTPVPSATPRPTPTPRPSATPRPTATPRPSASPTPTVTPPPTRPPVARVDLGASMSPRPDPAISDYTVRCAEGAVTATVTAGDGGRVTMDGGSALTTSTSVSIPLKAGQSLSWILEATGGPLEQHARCLPEGFPTLTTARTGSPVSQWYLFSPSLNSPAATQYAILTDTWGTPVWWMATGAEHPVDLSLLPDGRLAWTYPQLTGYSPAAVYRTVAWDGTPGPSIGEGLGLDHHDLVTLPYGDRLAIRYVPRDCPADPAECVDLTAWGGSAKATVIDGEVVQFDEQGQVVWQWSSRGRIDVAEAAPHRSDGAHLGGSDPDLWDTVHLNSVEPDGEDAVIVSSRHTDAVYRISRDTGEIEWKLGGTPTARSLTVSGMPVGTSLSGQHDARLLPDGTLTVFDNGGFSHAPRVLRLRIDAAARTATVAQVVTDPNGLLSGCCGSARALPGGGFLIGWGGSLGETVISETDAAGQPVVRIVTSNGFTYRAIPILPGVVQPATIRAGMDAMHPRSP